MQALELSLERPLSAYIEYGIDSKTYLQHGLHSHC